MAAHDRDCWRCARVSEGQKFIFSIREDGTLIRTRQSDLRKTRAKATLYSIKGYRPYDLLEHLGGNEKHCAAWNLHVIPWSEFAKKTCCNKLCQRQPENVDFRRNRMSFFGGQHSGVYSPYTQSHLLA